jgi:hypothetical protein
MAVAMDARRATECEFAKWHRSLRGIRSDVMEVVAMRVIGICEFKVNRRDAATYSRPGNGGANRLSCHVSHKVTCRVSSRSIYVRSSLRSSSTYTIQVSSLYT